MRAFVLGNYMNANFLYVDRLPLAGESLAATRIFQEHGGKGLNLAVGLHRLGVAVDLLIAVGADEAGAAVTRRLAEEGIDTMRVLTLGSHSGYGVGFIAPDGRNFLAAHLGANALLTTEHVEQARDVIGNADSVLASFEIPNPVILNAFHLARRLSKQTCLNPSPWRQIDNELLALTDVLVVNASEAALMFNQPDLEKLTRKDWLERLPALAQRISWQGRLLVVTLADAGCVALDEADTAVSQPAYPIQQVDATGAGDAFGSGLVWSLLRGLPLTEALRISNACGALIAAREGILDGLPRRAEVEAFMAAAAVPD
ncbi:MAG: ribokinase [Candidatus Competibacteraceae bacterium]|nr:ribokinase [Candidatus Competibacteraceae bacterium]MCB1822090.1 ribokinase [Candidatus Competibacteraceae bacterium]